MDCGGSNICEHGRRHENCNDCGGSRMCEHGRQRHVCKECGASSICPHDRRRNLCKDCGGTSICEHGRKRWDCADCDGINICEHGVRQRSCKDCGGANICEHVVNRHACAVCSPYKCEGCGLFVVSMRNEQGKRLCAGCSPHSKRRSLWDMNRPEMKVNAFLCDRFAQAYPVGTYAPFRSCGDNRKPDAVVVVGNLMAVVETDEDRHAEYELSCEWAKALQHGQSALMTDGVKRVAFVRFNPSTWKVGGVTVQCAMKSRLEELGGLIKHLLLPVDPQIAQSIFTLQDPWWKTLLASLAKSVFADRLRMVFVSDLSCKLLNSRAIRRISLRYAPTSTSVSLPEQ
ncbi:hypothetical protein BDZ88DRAFT_35247 [Geranomyces variabilis]|nr:hypothetical protein BDZ88DRAFT_35247 [Geranomyces variabilis]